MVFRPFRSRAARAAVAAAGVAALLATAGCASSTTDAASTDGDELVELTLQTSWIPLVQFGGSYIADAEGYYNEFGVDVDILPGGPDVDPMAAVAAGQADIALANADNVARANEQGADLVIIAAGFQKNPLAILSTPENPINTPADMEGAKIGVPAGDEAAQKALEAYNGLDAEKITTVPVSFDVAPLVSGEVDGMWVFYTEQPISYEENTGVEGVTMLTADYGYDIYAQVYVVTRDSLEDDAKRAAIEGFLAGEIKGWQEYVADPALAVDLTVNDYAKDGGLTVENQTKQAERQLALLVTPETEAHGLLWISAEGIAKNIETLDALGLPADESIFDTSVLEAVYAGANTIK